jgi:hypothetical protein
MNKGYGRWSTMKMNKGNGRRSTMKNKALYKADEQFEKRHRQGQEGIYLESIWHDVLEFQRTGLYDLMYVKTNELG